MTVNEYLEKYGEYYVKKPIPIKIVKMKKSFTVRTLHGKANGKEGDYVARTPLGDLYPIAANIFNETYVKSDKEVINERKNAKDYKQLVFSFDM